MTARPTRSAVALLFLAVAACVTNSTRVPPVALGDRRSPPPLVLGSGERLLDAKRRLLAGDGTLRPAYDALLRSADSALSLTPPTVMQKGKTPPSGEKHDYMSLAPYWWPDTTKPNGLPYVRRDGEVNPDSRLDHDGTRFQRMEDAVEALALAYYLTDSAKYSSKAGELLRVWFVDPATRMNPNLRFAQAVLGVNEGRGTGIIDTRHLPQLVDALVLLRDAPGWPRADDEAVVAWCRDYLTWLRTSENGRDEAAAENNHGTWYDAQVAALALFVGDSAYAREVIGVSAKRRIETQIAADGRQKLELERTRPLHYSLFNLDPFTQLAQMGRHVQVDLWNYTAPSGGSILAALRFVAPYADAATPWPTPQVTPATPDVFLLPLRRAFVATGDPAFSTALRRLPPDLTRTHRSRFLFPNTP